MKGLVALLVILLAVANVFGRNLFKKLMHDYYMSKLEKEIDGIFQDEFDDNKYFRDEPREQVKRRFFKTIFSNNIDEETVNKFDRDIKIKCTILDYTGEEMKVEKSNKRGVPSFVRKWPKNANGQLYIPYVIDTNSYTTLGVQAITGFINQMNAAIQCNSNVWKPRTNEQHYVRILSDGGCYSYLGRITSISPQPLSLGRGCVTRGITHHEMMHAMGFAHEQSRSDRDSHVQILRQNIIPSTLNNFRKDATTNNFKTEYDYRSIMHYGQRAFSSNGQITIRTIEPSKQILIGNREAMTQSDIFEINKFYECSSNPSTTTVPTTPQTVSTRIPTTPQTVSTRIPTTPQTVSTRIPTTTETVTTVQPTVTTVEPGPNAPLLVCTNYLANPCKEQSRGRNVRVVENGTFVEPRRGSGSLILFQRTEIVRQNLGCQCTGSVCPNQNFCLRFSSRNTADSNIIVLFQQRRILKNGTIIVGDSNGVQSREIDIVGICNGFTVRFALTKVLLEGQVSVKDVTVTAGKCNNDIVPSDLEENEDYVDEILEDQMDGAHKTKKDPKVIGKLRKLEGKLNKLEDELIKIGY